jgi:hypothetical protein
MRATYTGFQERTYGHWLDLSTPSAPCTLVAVPGGSYDIYPCSGLHDRHIEAQTAHEEWAAAPAGERGPEPVVPEEPTLPNDGQWQAPEPVPEPKPAAKAPAASLRLSEPAEGEAH